MPPASFDSTAYGPAVQRLLVPERLAGLGPGSPDERRRAELARLTPSDVLAGRRVVDEDMAAACLAGLWLYHDFLDEAHRLSQDLDTIEGSYWHAIVHRREPDPDNAKYWFRRVGRHPIFARLADEAARIAAPLAGSPEFAGLVKATPWDASAFVGLCQAAASGENEKNLACRRIQLREWELLFEYCYRRAGNDTSDSDV